MTHNGTDRVTNHGTAYWTAYWTIYGHVTNHVTPETDHVTANGADHEQMMFESSWDSEPCDRNHQQCVTCVM